MAGILKEKRVTVFVTPASTHAMRTSGAVILNDPIVVDGRIITANGPVAAKAFGEVIIEVLNQ